MSVPAYVCRVHGQALQEFAGEARCSQCPQPYPVRDAIWMLDVVNRPDRTVFDVQVLHNPIPLDLDKASQLLFAANAGPIRDANILDVGCGLGDLTDGFAQTKAISDSNIYAFDHSIESVRQAAANVRTANGNRVFFSTQDALQLFFADGAFDLVAGSAVLHHFLDYEGFLHEAARILKPGGIAVFSEPFFEGYFWPALFLKNAMEEHEQSLSAPENAGAAGIVALAEYMSRHRGHTPALEHMTDKHFFRESEVLAAAENAGFRSVRFANVSPPQFYQDWMPYFLDIYGVKHEAVRRTAIAQYESVKSFAGPLLPGLLSHFKVMTMRRR